MYPLYVLGGHWSFRTGSCSLRQPGYGHEAFNLPCNRFHDYGFRDRGPFDLCFCHHKVHEVRIYIYDYYAGWLTVVHLMYLLPLWPPVG
jgi:hypothetical protein